MRELPPASRNKTVRLGDAEVDDLSRMLAVDLADAFRKGDAIACLDFCEHLVDVPDNSIDLIVVDPPYNLSKVYGDMAFRKISADSYEQWLERWMPALVRGLKPSGSMYVCGDWESSSEIHRVLRRHVKVRSRITWERDKGRGALRNWKNNTEDVWFCTRGDSYTFNLDAVKVKKRVIAPYRDAQGLAKDWAEEDGQNVRWTAPSNVWTDITVPFWSMAENTEHPTQKPEKLIAKLVLASSNPGDLVFDPFLGSGTTAVVARKLKRRFVGCEIDRTYCCLALRRLQMARDNPAIQGFDGVFFHERNAAEAQLANRTRASVSIDELSLTPLIPAALHRT